MDKLQLVTRSHIIPATPFQTISSPDFIKQKSVKKYLFGAYMGFKIPMQERLVPKSPESEEVLPHIEA